jgi:hypothetical protein
MGNRVGIHHTLSPFDKNRCGSPKDLSHADVKDEDGGLEDAQTQDLLHQVPPGDEDIKAHHHEEDEDPVVVEAEYPHRSSLPLAEKK